MKEFNLKLNSWHRWVANFGGKRVGRDTDICSYTRAFLAGLFWLFMASALGCAIVGFFGVVLFNIFDMLFNGAGILPPTVIFFGVSAGLSLIAAFVTAKESYEERQYQQMLADKQAGIVREPGFWTLAYRKFKDRTCFKISFKE